MRSNAVPQDAPSLVIIDDHAAVREALAHLLRGHGLRVIGLAGSAQNGHELVLRRRPDLAVIDVRLTGESGVELTKRLIEQIPSLTVLLYTGELITPRAARSLLACGARGVALKTGDAQELIEAISCLANGGIYLDPRVAGATAEDGLDAAGELSAREREVLRLVGSGLSNERIAQALFLSPHTVRTHVRNSLRKLGVKTRAQAVLALERAEGTR